jgi:hypothetical protein
MALFFRRAAAFLDPEAERWHLETWAWFLARFGGRADLDLSPIVLPSSHFFPASETKGHARALHIMDCVKEHARMSGWPCRLESQTERPELRVGDVTALNLDHTNFPAGTFALSGNEAVVTYDPGSVSDPMKLIATLAHELAHYKLSNVAEDPPGGEDAHEPATDLLTIYLGFGIFGANSAFNFNQHQDAVSQGWSWSRLGYLSEREWIFALAVFLTLKHEPAQQLHRYLKDHLIADLGKAMRYLEEKPELLSGLGGLRERPPIPC